LRPAPASADLLALLPNAAELCRQKLVDGTSDNPQRTLEVRDMLRRLMPANVRLTPEPDNALFAEWDVNFGGLLDRTENSRSTVSTLPLNNNRSAGSAALADCVRQSVYASQPAAAA
jgi:hypothetical protein